MTEFITFKVIRPPFKDHPEGYATRTANLEDLTLVDWGEAGSLHGERYKVVSKFITGEVTEEEYHRILGRMNEYNKRKNATNNTP
jgi:hypothetical protein